MKTVFFAGGGTGGHVFPLVAVAEAMVELSPGLRPIFIGTPRGMETEFVPKKGFDLELLEVLPMRGAGLFGALRGAGRALSLLPESRRLLRKYGPMGVLSVGGYAAGPVSLAARLLGLPVVLLEPNSVIGLANRLVAPFVQRAYTAFEMAEQHFSPTVVRPFGVPIRPGFHAQPYALSRGRIRVLVLGGSQGAQSLNERVPEALVRVRGQLEGVAVLHQCGKMHQDSVERTYRALGAEFATVTSFIDDMPSALRDADIVIGRSGASAVSEIAAVGRPSLLIPYPYASGDHQWDNAMSLANKKAAICVRNHEATVERLTQELLGLCSDSGRLRSMADAARRFGRPSAAQDIARDFLELVSEMHSPMSRAEQESAGARARSALRLGLSGGY